MQGVIVANGELHKNTRLQQIWDRADLRIAADGGARNARLFLERAPHVVIGDMDSMDAETREWLQANGVEFLRYPSAKDETDLELALLLAQQRGATDLILLAAFGGRVDHFLANVMLLTRLPRVRIADAISETWVGTGAEDIHGRRGDIVSLIPVGGPVAGIITTALEYPLRAETLELGSTRGISNVMLGESAQVIWSGGTLLLVHVFQ